MDDGYELVEYRLDEDHVFWELKKTSHNLSELQKAMADSRLRESCHKLFLQLGKIIDYGVATSCQTTGKDNRLRRRYVMPDAKAQVSGFRNRPLRDTGL